MHILEWNGGRRRTNERNAFIYIIYSFFRSLVRSFCLTTPSHVSWINFFLSHAHILTRAFFYYSILFLGIVCVFDFHRFNIFFSSVAVLEFKWIYVCNTQAIFVHRHRAHISEKWQKRIKRQLRRKNVIRKWHFVCKYWNAADLIYEGEREREAENSMDDSLVKNSCDMIEMA